VKHRGEIGLLRIMSMFGRKEGEEEEVQPISSTPPYQVRIRGTDCGSIIFDSQFVVPYSQLRYNSAQPGLMRCIGYTIGCFEELM
jgi:hypothetical protein